jgi:hypothetical protein
MRASKYFASQPFLACKRVSVGSRNTHDDHKKSRNAPASDLPDSRRNHSAVPHYHSDDRNGNSGARSGHFDSDRQIDSRRSKFRAKPHVIWQRVEDNAFHLRAPGGSASPKVILKASRTRVTYSAPTAPEISKTTIPSEIKIWIIARTFAQRASSGASVGPKVELCVKATNR